MTRHRAGRALRRPIPSEKRLLLASRWEALDPRWHLPTQGLGRQATGCGATIGILPRCDFACDGCYLPSQLELLRAYLGPKGNVQITDGDVTQRERLGYGRVRDEFALMPLREEFARDNPYGPRLVSLQPLARVGRTRAAVAGVTPGDLWTRVANALRPYGFENPGAGPVRDAFYGRRRGACA